MCGKQRAGREESRLEVANFIIFRWEVFEDKD
jgi:hypothetical protein